MRSSKDGKPYRVCVFIVDDTYWDDGNRTTRRDHDFATVSEAVAFMPRKDTWYKTTSRVTGEKLRCVLKPDDFVLRRFADGVWHNVDELDIVTLLGEVAGD